MQISYLIMSVMAPFNVAETGAVTGLEKILLLNCYPRQWTTLLD